MSLTLAPVPHQQFLTNAGVVLSGGFLYTYAAGTSTLLATYSDEDGLVVNANPILLNTAGRPWNSTVEINVYLLPRAYKFVLQTSAGVEVWSSDHVPAVPTLETALDIPGTAGEAFAARDEAYLSTSDGKWYLADADAVASSTEPGSIAVATAAIASGDSGTFRMQGRVTGYSALTAGAIYYLSATPGGITVTAPGNSRKAGQADSTTSLVVGGAPATLSVNDTNLLLTGQVFS